MWVLIEIFAVSSSPLLARPLWDDSLEGLASANVPVCHSSFFCCNFFFAPPLHPFPSSKHFSSCSLRYQFRCLNPVSCSEWLRFHSRGAPYFVAAKPFPDIGVRARGEETRRGVSPHRHGTSKQASKQIHTRTHTKTEKKSKTMIVCLLFSFHQLRHPR